MSYAPTTRDFAGMTVYDALNAATKVRDIANAHPEYIAADVSDIADAIAILEAAQRRIMERQRSAA